MTEGQETQILTCNRLAMDWLRKGKIKKAEGYLSKAQGILKACVKSRQTYHLLAITFNNLGCVYKRKNEFEKALKYLENALNYEENYLNDVLNLAGIHLNMSAIYSQLNSHDISLKHALAAKKILLSKPEKDQNIWVSLVICYQSGGYEHECLLNFDQALDMYLKGWEIAQDHLGAFHSITEKIKKNFSILSKSVKTQKSKFPSRSKTPSLLPKASNLSLIDKPSLKVAKDSQNSRFESKKNFDTLDLLISEVEVGKSESSTEVPSYGKPEYLKKLGVPKARVLTFEKLQRVERSFFGVQKNQPKVEYKVEEKDLKIETDEEYSDEFLSESIEGPEIPTVRSHVSSSKSEISIPRHEETQEDSQRNPQKTEKALLDTIKEPELLDLNISKLQEKLFSDKSVQTENTEKSDNSCQTTIKLSPFRRIAAIIIQKYWRAYKRSKDPGYYEYINEIQKARLEAEQALNKVDQIKLVYKHKKKQVTEGPVPKRSKMWV